MAFLLSDDILHHNTRDLEAILGTFCEIKVEVPRQRLLDLIPAKGKNSAQPPAAAILLLGLQHHPDDLQLLERMTSGDGDLAELAMPGLLAWHGLEGYRERLKKLEDEKGFAGFERGPAPPLRR